MDKPCFPFFVVLVHPSIAPSFRLFASQGLDSHRHSAAQFEEPARRRGLQLICIDRPGRGLSDPIPPPEGADVDSGGSAEAAAQSQDLMSEAIEAAVVDTIKQVNLCSRLDWLADL